jgi:hypothetical protein
MIEARGLTKRFGETIAADGLTFSVRSGLAAALLGDPPVLVLNCRSTIGRSSSVPLAQRRPPRESPPTR